MGFYYDDLQHKILRIKEEKSSSIFFRMNQILFKILSKNFMTEIYTIKISLMEYEMRINNVKVFFFDSKIFFDGKSTFFRHSFLKWELWVEFQFKCKE